MYPVSNAYLLKMLDQSQTHRISGAIAGIDFTEADVIGVSYAGQCADKNVTLGSVAISQFKCTFVNGILPRGDYYGAEITISDELLIGYDENDDPIYEGVPIGTFYVAEATWTAAGMVDVVAYDSLSKLDIPVTFDQASATAYGWLNVIAQACGVTNGMTQEECEALPNGSRQIAIYAENEITTYRDLLSSLAKECGGFGYSNRNGGICLKAFKDTSDPVITIPKTRRYSGFTVSDFETRFDGIVFDDLVGEKRWYYPNGCEDGNVMDLGDMPFLQYGEEPARIDQLDAIYAIVAQMQYTPFKAQALPAFVALDLGDIVALTSDYSGETSLGCVMTLNWQYNNAVTLQGLGSNPNLSKGKSKTDNKVTGAGRYGGGGKLSTFVATNAEDITINTTETEIVRANFTVADNSAALALFEVKFTIPDPNDDEESGPIIPVDELVDIFYYIDGHAYDYQPSEHFNDAGIHTISLMLPIVGESSDSPHQLVVKMRTVNGGVTVDALDSHLYIQSTGVAGEARWDGWIRADDEFRAIPWSGLGFVDTTDDCALITGNNVDAGTLSDTTTAHPIGAYTNLIDADDCDVIIEGGFAIETESGLELRADQDMRLTTE